MDKLVSPPYENWWSHTEQLFVWDSMKLKKYGVALLRRRSKQLHSLVWLYYNVGSSMCIHHTMISWKWESLDVLPLFGWQTWCVTLDRPLWTMDRFGYEKDVLCDKISTAFVHRGCSSFNEIKIANYFWPTWLESTFSDFAIMIKVNGFNLGFDIDRVGLRLMGPKVI